jgi:predicted flap endonuclease-1-like 5' DNA nuclease
MLQELGLPVGLWAFGLNLTGFSRTAAPLAEQEGNPWWIWLLIFAALVSFVVFVIWWWLRSSAEEEKEALSTSPQRMASLESSVVEPAALDDLKRIEGIGPKISSVLQAAGITTFAQLSQTSVDRIKEALEAENPNLLRLADPTTWPEQAALAAQGEWEALAQLQDELKGGRRA